MSTQQPQGNGGVILLVVAVGLVTFGLGWLVGNYNQAPADADRGDRPAAVAADVDRADLGDSDQIPVGDSPILGNPEAPVTIVEFTSMQCPFCGRAAGTLGEVLDKYEDDVRIVFKHFPLGNQQQAKPASKLMEAARRQDEAAFWTMKDELFERLQDFRDFSDEQMADLGAELAEEMGLDPDQLREDFEDPELDEIIDADAALGRQIGVRGTPAFFINGEQVGGAQPLEEFSKIIDAQLELVEELREDGVEANELYAAAVRHNLGEDDGADERAEPSERRERERPQPAPDVDLSEGIPVGDSPIMGNPDAPVTVVEFTSMQCPFCARGADTLEQLVERYEDEVRVVFKHFPLGMQQQAEPASRLLEAARRQDEDSFWKMKSALFDRLGDYGEGKMEDLGAEIAEELGLDPDQLREDFKDPALARLVRDDQSLGRALGVRGTPHFFVNGEVVNGAQPLPRFAEVVDGQLELLEELKEEGVAEDELYAAAVQRNMGADGDSDPQPEPERPEADTVDADKLVVGDSYTKGPDDAPVKIFEFSSFQCPFCARARETTNRILEEYDGQVQLVYKNFPLGMQEHSEPASRAALAAGEQGSFWEMYDKIYDNQRRLGESGIFEELAGDLGLNMDRFRQDFESDAIAQQVRKEQSEGQELGVRGTPHFFVNGKSMRGAQPFEEFKRVIDSELADN